MLRPHKPTNSFWAAVPSCVRLCYCGSMPEVCAALERIENVNLQYGAEKWTLLHVAVMRGGREGAFIAKRLLALGANKELEDSYGWTAKAICLFSEQEEVFSGVFNSHRKGFRESVAQEECFAAGSVFEAENITTQRYFGRINEVSGVQEKLGTGTSGIKCESSEEEYKVSGVFSAKTSKLEPLYQAWVLAKTIAGMANNKGGRILLGVNNSGKIVGLWNDFVAEDLDKLSEMDRLDKYELSLRKRIEMMFKNRAVAGVLFELKPKKSEEGKDYFVISIQKSEKTPIFICKEPKTTTRPTEFKEFYLRLGGATKCLSYKDATGYIKNRFLRYAE